MTTKLTNLHPSIEERTAAGKANLVKGEWIKPGAIVIDVGPEHIGLTA